ncbi:MAG: hypothetical protein KGJ41_00115 [Rhodospirillales bacterium]|nr:hypothetical protein [Rhodospirillales bacterium]MDE2197394.1 hypothetical protein [Rhodospirillales bacterium]MDE2575541.1 hypothetical protein [Rhodospirillales bacterium]
MRSMTRAAMLVAAAGTLAMPAFAQTLSPPPAPLGGTAPAQAPAALNAPEQKLPVTTVPTGLVPSSRPEAVLAPLPVPDMPADATVHDFLVNARQALAAGRAALAQESLERAESRALTRSVRPSRAGDPSGQALVRLISRARAALATGDEAVTTQRIDAAIAAAKH